MAKQETTDEDAAANATGDPEARDAAARAAKVTDHGRRALRNLRGARRLYQDNDWSSSEEAAFYVREANVLAILDLAEAVRAQDSGH